MRTTATIPSWLGEGLSEGLGSADCGSVDGVAVGGCDGVADVDAVADTDDDGTADGVEVGADGVAVWVGPGVVWVAAGGVGPVVVQAASRKTATAVSEARAPAR